MIPQAIASNIIREIMMVLFSHAAAVETRIYFIVSEMTERSKLNVSEESQTIGTPAVLI